MSKSTRQNRTSDRQGGFTLIEMIGVLAIIAVLVAVVAPRIFKSVGDSKVDNMALTIKTTQTALSEYFKDVNVIQAIDAAGDPVGEDATGNLLPAMLVRAKAAGDTVKLLKRFQGPYLDKFNKSGPPMGTEMTMPYDSAAAAGTAAAGTEGTTWDLDGDGNNDLKASQQAVFLSIANVSQDEFDKLDNMLDAGLGSTDAQRQARGKVKWGANTMRVLVEYK